MDTTHGKYQLMPDGNMELKNRSYYLIGMMLDKAK